MIHSKFPTFTMMSLTLAIILLTIAVSVDAADRRSVRHLAGWSPPNGVLGGILPCSGKISLSRAAAFPFVKLCSRGSRARGKARTVSVPEPAFLGAILPKLPREIKLGLGIRKAVTTQLQYVTAGTAAMILRAVQIPARQRGIDIELPSVVVRVIDACAGHLILELFLIWALVLAYVSRTRRLRFALVLGGAAALLAFEANVLRIAGVAAGLEYVDSELSLEWKERIGTTTVVLALLQLTWLGRFLPRFAVLSLRSEKGGIRSDP